MPLYINTNTLSLNAQRNLSKNTDMLSKSMERLSSGLRINRAGDDAAGLQLSENLLAQVNGSKKALDNVNDGINMLNVADGGFQTIEDNLQRVRELLVQAGNDTYAQKQRDAMAQEIGQLLQDNDRIAHATNFDGVNLMDGSLASFNLQVGPNADPNPLVTPPGALNTIDVATALTDMTAGGGGAYGAAMQANLITSGNPFFAPGNPPTLNSVVMGPGNTGAISSNADAQDMITQIDAAINAVNTARGNLGAFVNRLQGVAQNLSIGVENLQAADARIRDVDVAAESAQMTQAQVLQQSSALVLSQANHTPDLALQLLKQ